MPSASGPRWVRAQVIAANAFSAESGWWRRVVKPARPHIGLKIRGQRMGFQARRLGSRERWKLEGGLDVFREQGMIGG